MSNRSKSQTPNYKTVEYENDFEDYGYDVKNVRRSSKKKVNKFKTQEVDYYDTNWSACGKIVFHISTGFSTGLVENY